MHRLAPLVVGHAVDGAVDDLGVFAHHRFDIRRVHIEAAGDDHFLGAAAYEQVTVLVLLAQVAGMQPAIDQRRR